MIDTPAVVEFVEANPAPRVLANSEASILHVVGDSAFGGAALGIIRLASRDQIRARGWKVAVLATDPGFVTALNDAGITVVHLAAVWRGLNVFKDLVGLIRLWLFLKRNPWTVVHTHTTKGGIIGRLAARLAGIPIVIHTIHGFAIHERTNICVAYIYGLIERVAAAWCTRIVTVSHFHRAWAIKFGIPCGKIVAIPNGVPDRGFARKFREPNHCPHDSCNCTILYLGRLAAGKGIEDLLEATAVLAKRGRIQVSVNIVGDGPSRIRLESIAKTLGVQQIVSFVGHQKDVSEYLTTSDLVVLPTFREGMSISLLEAMAAGKPIVTTNIGSNKEATRNGYAAILVEPGDVAALADAVQNVLEDPKLSAELSRRSRERYEEDYKLERMLSQYAGLYDELITLETG